MRVAYYYHIPATRRSGGLITTNPQARTITDLATHADSVLVIAHRPAGRGELAVDTEVSLDNVELVSLPPLPHPLLAWILGPLFMAIAWRSVRKAGQPPIDLTILRSPSTLTGWIGRATSGPIALLVVGDYFEWTTSSRRGPMERFVAHLFSRIQWSEAKSIARRGLVFVNGRNAVKKWQQLSQRVVLVSTNPLLRSEVPQLDLNTADTPEMRLLFVGRIEREKGIADALAAFDILRDQGHLVSMKVVGPLTDPDLDLGDSRGVEVVGAVEYGPALFEAYSNSDILLCLSHHESFPRVIWEAMAFGLPVVATDVGAIRSTLGSDTAVLVAPHDPEAAAHAAVALWTDRHDRESRISSGRSTFERMLADTPTVGEAARDALSPLS